MNRKGGLLGNIIVLAVVFLVGTFFGWTILGNVFGEDVEKLSPSENIDQSTLVELCSQAEIQQMVCDNVEVVEVPENIELTSYNTTNQS